ncbi:MAG TPA: class I SAM-dependent methyltransferase [Candidatus Dormibacteraeota bacterium]|nr:class I SAM-dependent methyltransferase [Candidatus Dormibacteraeota bacterium]
MKEARDWANAAMVKRPWRADFFARIGEELAALRRPLSILELGSGPGFLAQHLLMVLPTSRYTALDFSSAMHQLARERLGDLADRATFVEADFRRRGWTDGLPRVDAVVSMQAVHELRHKRHAPRFYRAVCRLLKTSGTLLVCDHYSGERGMSNCVLFMTPDEQEAALKKGGFQNVDLLMLKGGLVLFRASRNFSN